MTHEATHGGACAVAAASPRASARGWLIPRPHGGGSWKFGAGDFALSARAVRVPLREGSLLVWDQRSAHRARPNSSHYDATFVASIRSKWSSVAMVQMRRERGLVDASETNNKYVQDDEARWRADISHHSLKHCALPSCD